MIQLLYFAGVREAMGCSEQQLELPAEVRSVGQLRDHLLEKGAPWSDALTRDQQLLYAVNEEVAGEEHTIESGDEVAFFPPVTGG